MTAVKFKEVKEKLELAMKEERVNFQDVRNLWISIFGNSDDFDAMSKEVGDRVLTIKQKFTDVFVPFKDFICRMSPISKNSNNDRYWVSISFHEPYMDLFKNEISQKVKDVCNEYNVSIEIRLNCSVTYSLNEELVNVNSGYLKNEEVLKNQFFDILKQPEKTFESLMNIKNILEPILSKAEGLNETVIETEIAHVITGTSINYHEYNNYGGVHHVDILSTNIEQFSTYFPRLGNKFQELVQLYNEEICVHYYTNFVIDPTNETKVI